MANIDNNADNHYLYMDGVEVTFDTDADVDERIGDNPEVLRLYVELRELLVRQSPQAIRRISLAVEKYPNIAAFKNFLTAAYSQVDNDEKVYEWVNITVEKHPMYFMGILEKCKIEMKDTQEIAIVEKYFGGEPLSPTCFAPHRKRFHSTEMNSFYELYAIYYRLKGEPDKVVHAFECLHSIGTSKKIAEILKRDLIRLVILKNMKRFEVMSKKNQEKTQDGYFKAEKEQRTEAPVFQHPELEKRYTYGLDIPTDFLNAVLSLPRESLIADLRLMIQDMVYRFHYWEEQEDIHFSSYDVIFAILTEIEATEALPDILHLLSQGEDFLVFWLGGDFQYSLTPLLRTICKNQWAILMEFMKAEEIYSFSKTLIPQAISEIVRLDETQRAAAIAWYREIVQYYLDNADNDKLIDRIVLASLTGDICDIAGKELMPLLKEVYDRDLADVLSMGDWKEVAQEFEYRKYLSKMQVFESIHQRIAFLRKEFRFEESSEDIAFREKLFYEQINKDREQDYLKFWENEEKMPTILKSAVSKPHISKPQSSRNDKVSVEYTDGKVVKEVKYKKVEDDVLKGKCVII